MRLVRTPWLALLLLFAVVCCGPPVSAQPRSPLITQNEARRHGLERAWFTQVEVNPARDKLAHLVLYRTPPAPQKPAMMPPAADAGDEGDPAAAPAAEPAAVRPDAGTLYAQTEQNVITAIDAATGRRLWVSQFGERDKPSEPLAVNENYVVMVNGTDLYVVNRGNGILVSQKPLQGIPYGGVTVSSEWVFVPFLSGEIVGIKLPAPDEPLIPQTGASTPDATRPAGETPGAARAAREAAYEVSWSYFSDGRLRLPPVVTETGLAWATTRGYVYLGAQATQAVGKRFLASMQITAPLTYWPPNVFAASRDGYLYAINEETADSPWSFSLGEPLGLPPVALNGRVYVFSNLGGMTSLTADTGQRLWWSPRATRLLASSGKRLYVVTRFGEELRILDPETGARVDGFPIDRLDFHFTNTSTDRIFLGTKRGLLTCLHEIGQNEPLFHEWPKTERGPRIGPMIGENPIEGEAMEDEGEADEETE